MRLLTEATGGRFYLRWTELHRALGEIEEENRKFYLLTYAPPPPYGDGKRHTIRVTVRVPGVTVRARSGYVDAPIASSIARVADIALAVPGLFGGKRLAAQVYRKWSRSGDSSLLLAVAVPPSQLLHSGAGSGDATIELRALALDPEGKIVDRFHELLKPTRAPLADDPAAGTTGYVYTRDWQLPPGPYDIRVALSNDLTGEVRVARLSTELLGRTGGWAVSDPLLFVGGKPPGPVPLLTSEVTTGRRLYGYLETSGAEATVLRGTVIHESRQVRTNAIQVEPDRRGICRGLVALGGLARPGRYTIVLEATDVHGSKRARFEIPIDVIDEPAAG